MVYLLVVYKLRLYRIKIVGKETNIELHRMRKEANIMSLEVPS
jgi:hypothetical protein